MDKENQQKEVADLSNVLRHEPDISENPPIVGGNNLNTPKIIPWVIRNFGGIIKNEKQAILALIIVSILLIAISIILPVSQNKKPVITPSPVGDNPLLK